MKLFAGLLAAPLLVAFVTWLSLDDITSGAARFNRALGELDRIAQTEGHCLLLQTAPQRAASSNHQVKLESFFEQTMACIDQPVQLLSL